MLRMSTYAFILSASLFSLSFSSVAADAKDAQELASVKSALQLDGGEPAAKKQLEALAKLSKSKELPVAYEATALLSECHRNANDLKSAERVLEKFDSFTGFEKLPANVAIPYFQCLLESAYVKALKGDVQGSLAILNWANARESDYEKALACIKYAEILVDLSEPERAKEYLKSFKSIAAKRLNQADAGASIGQGGDASSKDVSTWKALADKSFKLELEVEGCEIGKKFGDTYANYVKLRRIQAALKKSSKPRFYNEAMKLADEIISTDPASQFAAAAAYLKGDLMASKLTDKSSPKDIKAAKEVLEKLAKQKPDALYKGEALMLLGKISLEIEWNAKSAWDWYSAAYEHFKKTRELRDTLSLYAPVSDELKKQAAPTTKATTLDRWNRIVYNDQDPLKLYNTASSPAWYIDDNEKNCVFALGFLAFVDGKFDVAANYWSKVLALSSDIAATDQRLPNVQTRLLKAAQMHLMCFWPEDKAAITDKKMALQLQYAEMLEMIERHDAASEMFKKIADETSEVLVKAIATFGLCENLSLVPNNENWKQMDNLSQWIIAQQKLQKEPIYARAVLFRGNMRLSTNGMVAKALPYFEQYLKDYPKGREVQFAKFRKGECLVDLGKIVEAENMLHAIGNEESIYFVSLSNQIKEAKKKGGTGNAH